MVPDVQDVPAANNIRRNNIDAQLVLLLGAKVNNNKSRISIVYTNRGRGKEIWILLIVNSNAHTSKTGFQGLESTNKIKWVRGRESWGEELHRHSPLCIVYIIRQHSSPYVSQELTLSLC